MSGTMIIFKATGKILINFLPATVFVAVGLAVFVIEERREMSGKRAQE